MLIRFLADEDFRGPFLNALNTVAKENRLAIEISRVQDVGLLGADDTTVLDSAAQQDRIVLTFDLRTMPPCAWDRISRGLPMSGLIVISPQGVRAPRDTAEKIVVEALDRAEHQRGWDDQVAIV